MLSTLGIIATLVAATLGQQPHCTSLDYRVVRGSCSAGKRKVEWVKEPRLEVWDCTGDERIARPDESCDCVPDDVSPVYKGNLITKWVTHHDIDLKPVCEATAVLPKDLPTGTTVPKCAAEDIGFEFTDCDLAMRQQVVSYYIKHCEPGKTTVSLGSLHDLVMSTDRANTPSNYFIKLMKDAAVPILESAGPGFSDLNKYIGMEISAIDDQPFTLADLHNLPKGSGERTLTFVVRLPPARTLDCNKQCEAGTYLAPPMSSCGYCPMGTHSIRGDIYNSWTNDSWPANFATRCYATPEVKQWECNEFTMRGSYIDSGDQPAHRSTTSLLNVLVDIVTQPAELKLTMKRDLVDEDTVALYVNNRLLKYWAGGQTEWEEFKQVISVDSCTWKLALYTETDEVARLCVYRNQFAPFLAEHNFPYVMLQEAATYEMVHLNADGCDAAQYSTDVTGKVVYLHRDGNRACSFVDKGLIAQAKGAVGVVITDYVDEQPLIMGGNSTGLNIPMASIKYVDGTTLLAHWKSNMHIKIGRTEPGETSAIVQLVVSRDRSATTYGGKVMIEDMHITGTQYAAPACTECPQGHYSAGGIDQPEGCAICPEGTYSQQGSAECRTCPPGKTSRPGSGTCFQVEQCREQDYVPSFGPCVTPSGGSPTMNLTWVCSGKTPGTPPPDEVVPCGAGEEGDCMREGHIRNDDNTCTPCLGGTVANSDTRSCVDCPAGMFSNLVYDMSKGFDSLGHSFSGDAWSTKCTESCDFSSGWEFTLLPRTAGSLPQTALVAGRTKTSVAVDLLHKFTVTLEGAVEFTYRVEGEQEDMSAVSVYLIIIKLKTGKSDGGQDAETRELLWSSHNLIPSRNGNLTHTLHPGNYELTWAYRKKQTTTVPVLFYLTGLTVRGSSLGAGTSCGMCPAGHSCTDSVQPCAAGTYRMEDSDPAHCTPCPAGTVATEGSAQCSPCSGGTRAEGTPPTCNLIGCRWVSPKGDAFDLTPLQGATDEARYTVNLCKKSPSCAEGALACTNDTSGTLSYGSSIAVEQTDNGITVTLTEGGACPVDPWRQLGSVIRVLCDPIKREEYTAHSKVALADSSDMCMPVYTVTSRSGCRLCAESVTEEYWTSCVNGTQERVRKYGNCFGAKGDSLDVRECGGGSSKKWLPFVIIFSLLAVGGLGFFVFRLYRQNTELECKYSHVNTDETFHDVDDAIALPEDDQYGHDEEEGQVI